MTSPIIQVASKELREMFRDKRVRSSAFFGPFFLVFVLLYLFGFITSTVSKPGSTKLHVVKSSTPNPIIDALREKKVTIIDVPSAEEGTKLVQDGKASAVLQFEDDYFTKAQQGEPTNVKIIYDSKEQKAQIAIAQVERAIEQANKAITENYLVSHGMPKTVAAPIKTENVDVTKAKGASELLTGILPYLIVIWAFFGGMSSASDLVAGEKERTTLETLLISPVPRRDIVLGKFLALGSVCMLSSLSSLVAVLLYAALRMKGADILFKDGTGITGSTVLATVAVLIPTVMLFAGLLVAISSYAKNSREAQSYLSLASFAVMMPALFSQFIGFTDYASARWINLVPVLNTATTIRSALLGKIDVVGVLITVAVGLVLGLAMIWIAAKLFTREQVLTRV